MSPIHFNTHSNPGNGARDYQSIRHYSIPVQLHCTYIHHDDRQSGLCHGTGEQHSLTYYLTIPTLFSSTQLQDYEALGMATVINQMLMHFPLPTFLTLPPELMASFTDNLTKLTTNFGQAAAQEEAVSRD